MYYEAQIKSWGDTNLNIGILYSDCLGRAHFNGRLPNIWRIYLGVDLYNLAHTYDYR